MRAAARATGVAAQASAQAALAAGPAAFLAFIGAWLLVGTDPVAAQARCVPSSPEAALATTQIVFVGTVTATTNEGRWAQVRVDEEWRGGPLPAVVEVRGGGEPGTATSVDRVFGPLPYLFFVRQLAPGLFADDACSATTAWSPELAALRPPGALIHEPLVEIGGVNVEPLLPVIALVVLLLIVVVSYALVWRARRRPPDWIR